MDKNCKYKCQIFTPIENVEELLDWAEYKKNIYGKKVIENSCWVMATLIKRRSQESCDDCQGLMSLPVHNRMTFGSFL